MTKSSKNLPPFKSEEYLTPVSLSVQLTGLFLLGVVGMTIVLASSLKYNTIAKGRAFIRPFGEIRIVHAQREGTIKDIPVKTNQKVTQGDVLAILDQTELKLQEEQISNNIQQTELRLSQIKLQMNLVEQQIIAESQSLDQAILIAQLELNKAQEEYQNQKLSALATLQELQANLQLAQDEMERYQALVTVGAISELQLQEKKAALQTAEARLSLAQSQINPNLDGVRIAEEKRAQAEHQKSSTLANLNQQRETLAQNITEIENQLTGYQNNFKLIEHYLATSTVRAPVDGVILQLNLKNEQQFVTANEVIAQIMPDNVGLVVKAYPALFMKKKTKPKKSEISIKIDFLLNGFK